jgi:RNA polymerase sigma factor (sigma-70 family)
MGDDDLRNIFTAFMQQVVHNAKIDYIRRNSAKVKTETSLDVADQTKLSYEQNFGLTPQNEFDFQNDRLVEGFALLSAPQRKIITLLFAQGLTASEAAGVLDCPVEYIYDQKRKSLQKLRKQMTDGGAGGI